jgi:hypothetical protein
MSWVWTLMVAMLMVPPTLDRELAERDGLPTTRSPSSYRLSPTGEELWGQPSLEL